MKKLSRVHKTPNSHNEEKGLSIKENVRPSSKHRILEMLPPWISLILSLVAIIMNSCQNINQYNNEQYQKYIAQARSISAWINGNHEGESGICLDCVVNNSSQNPVYDFTITPVPVGSDINYGKDFWKENNLNKDDYGATIHVLPPGKYTTSVKFEGYGMSAEYQLEIAFRDSSGTSWIIDSNGILQQISKDPFSYYDIPKLFPDNLIEQAK